MHYELNYNDATPEENPYAVVRVPVELIGDHFALRIADYYLHPAGEGMWIPSYALDHIPSGLALMRSRSTFEPLGERTARAFARSLLTIPVDVVDWSLARPDLVATTDCWIRKAYEAAHCGQRSIDYATGEILPTDECLGAEG